jgi:hypothetical protein
MQDIVHNRDAAPASIAQATAEARRQASALSAAVREALELQAAAVRADDFERVAAGLRDRQRAVTELVLECLRGQEAMTERVLECLGGLEAMTEKLSQRLSALESGLATATVPETTPREPDEPSPTADEPSPTAEGNGALAAPGDAMPHVEAKGPAPERRRGPVTRLLSRAGSACAVCQCDAPRGSKRELSRAGWAITGHSVVCPGCRAMGWRLGDAGGLPFRQRTMTEG